MLNSKRNLRHQFFFLLIHISCLLQKCILLSTTLFPQSCVFSSVSFRRFLCPCVFIQVLCLCLCLSFCFLPRLLFLWVTGLEDYLQQKYVYLFFPPFLVSSCWLPYTNNLIWIFAAFMAFVEVVSLKLVSPSHFPF